MKAIVITGVSSGIGHATAALLVKSGFRVFGSVRKQVDASRLSQEFGGNFTPLIFDVTDENAVNAAARLVREQLNGEILFGLVNNAGIIVAAPLLHASPKDFRQLLNVNLAGVLVVTQAFTPLLGSDRSLRGFPGRIINVGSVSGTRAVPFLGPYIASKYGLEGFSDTLRLELMLYGIKVILIGPGLVATPLYNKAAHTDLPAFLKTDFASSILKFKEIGQKRWKNALPPERVAAVVLKALTVPCPKMRYTVVTSRFKDWILPRFLPKRTLAALLGKRLGLMRSAK
jgi:NAD(P)-dependent dehydrogenase (short-subunit alcohol dehydrogenase family)